MVVQVAFPIWAFMKCEAFSLLLTNAVTKTGVCGEENKKKQASVNLHNLLDFYHFQKKTANTNARTRFEGKKMTLRASRTEHEKSEHIYWLH